LIRDEIVEFLKKFANDERFDDLYFVGGTALQYYLNHRISYDVDFISLKKLDSSLKSITVKYDANFLPDPNASQFKINSGEDIDSYKLAFSISGIKLEIFHPNDEISLEILKKFQPNSSVIYGGIKILPIEAISLLKLLAFFRRDKIRDLFDIYVLFKRDVLSVETIERYCALHSLKTFVEYVEEFEDDGSESIDFDKSNSYYQEFADLNSDEILQTIKRNLIDDFIKKVSLK